MQCLLQQKLQLLTLCSSLCCKLKKRSNKLAVQRARDIVRISFGAQQINDLLGGGLESKAITEMFGEYRWDLSLAAYMLLLLAMIS